MFRTKNVLLQSFGPRRETSGGETYNSGLRCLYAYSYMQCMTSEKADEYNRFLLNEITNQELESKINDGARRITRFFSRLAGSRVLARRVLQRRAAVKIQKFARGKLGRERFRNMWFRHKVLSAAALIIQMAARRRIAVRKVRLRKKLNFVSAWLARQDALAELRLLQVRRNGAAGYISLKYRAYRTKQQVQKLLYWHRFAMSIVIQKYGRRYVAFRDYKVLSSHGRQRKALEHRSAVFLQKQFRRFVAQCVYERYLQEKEHAMQRRIASKLAILARGPSFRTRSLNLLGSLKPFKYVLFGKKATAIQKVYRGHHGRKRALLVTIFNAIAAFNNMLMRKFNSAAKIQRVWRGFICRLKRNRQAQKVMIIKLQCFVRRCLAYKLCKRLRREDKAARTITRNLFRRSKQRSFARRRAIGRSVWKNVVMAQCLARCFLARTRVSNSLTRLRGTHERTQFLQRRINSLLFRVQLRLLLDSMDTPIGARYEAVVATGGDDCPCLGPLQAVFVQGVCSKGYTELAALFSNKADASGLNKFMNRIQGLSTEEGKSVKTGGAQRRKGAKEAAKEESLVIVEEVSSGRLKVCEPIGRVSQSDIDLSFQKSKVIHLFLPYREK
jgi:hypothetical protein